MLIYLSFFHSSHHSMLLYIHFNKIIFKLTRLLIIQECIKWLDAADDGDEKTVCEVNPLRELQVDERCSIKGIIVAEDHWLIQVRTILKIFKACTLTLKSFNLVWRPMIFIISALKKTPNLFQFIDHMCPVSQVFRSILSHCSSISS